MRKNRLLLIVLSLAAGAIVFCVPGCRSNEYANTTPAPIVQSGVQSLTSYDVNQNRCVATNHQWAAEVNLPGAPNLHKVSDNLYRGAQPSDEGFRQLKKSGIKTVINLRSFHSDRDELKDVNMSYEHIPMKTWHPEDEDVVQFLRIVTDANRTPVFVHCQHGADRTGTMCAIYRAAVQGWSKDEALEEMTKGDFGFHGIWQNLVDYIRGLDIDKIRKQSGINN